MRKKYFTLSAIILSVLIFSLVQLNASENILKKYAVKNIIIPQNAIAETRLDIRKEKTATMLNKSADADAIEYKGKTFETIPFEEKLGIKTFNRKTARKYYNKELFSEPKHTASWYKAIFDENGISAKTTYVQLVNDPKWNRILYSSVNSDIKSYDKIDHPGEMVINAVGKVFVCEASKNRIQVLQINENQDEMSLQPLFVIDRLKEPVALAYHDNGTPLNDHDDFLFVADAADNTIIKFKLTGHSAEKAAVYEGFEWPLSIACGRWDGANNDLLYIIDHYAKHLTVARESESGLEIINRISAENTQTFSKVQTDYFGQVYLSETINSAIYKFSAGLELLATEKLPANKAINDISIPFGTIELKGEGTYWTGFDQLFAVQNWSEESGVNRYKLGLAAGLKDIKLSGIDNLLSCSYRITDFAGVRFRILSDGREIFQSTESWQPSGDNEIIWNRKNRDNKQAAQGVYDLEIEYRSAYGDNPLLEKRSFYLPLSYHIDCGAEDDTPVFSAIRGNAVSSGKSSWREDPDEVVYSLSGLDPEASYSIAVLIINNNSAKEKGELIVDGYRLVESVTNQQNGDGFQQIPSDIYSDGRILISVRKKGGDMVAVSDIWIKETNGAVEIFDVPDILPAETQLSQNYPNPFNPETLIKYNLREASVVELVVYDMLGREVESLVNQFQQPGSYSFKFDGNNLSSGIYLYQLKAGKTIETRKMLLLK